MDELEKMFKDLSARSLAATILIALLLVRFIVEQLETASHGRNFMQELIRAGVHMEAGQIEANSWFAWLLFALFALIVVLSVLFVHARLLRNTGTTAAQRCIVHMMDAAARIRSQQTPNASHMVKAIDEVRLVYRVDRSFNARILREYKMRAVGGPLHFWESSCSTSDEAAAVEYLSEIDFKIFNTTDPANCTPMTYLQTENGLRSKKFCVYFLPRLMETDPARTIQISYTWPRFFMQIKKKGGEELFSSFKSAEATKHVRVEVYLQPGTGGVLRLESVNRPSAMPIAATDADTGWAGYVYHASDLPPGEHEHQLNLRWEKA